MDRPWTIADDLGVSVIHPSKLQTREELGAAIRELVGRRSTRELALRFKKLVQADAAKKLPPTRASMSHSVIAYWYKGSRTPGRAELRLLLRSVGESPDGSEVDEDELNTWDEAVMRIEKGSSELEPTEPAEPPTRMQTVRDYIMEREAREYAEASTNIFKELTRDPSREVLLRALRTATEGGLISTAGVRMPVWETNLHYRYVLGDDPELQVTLESDDQSVLSTEVWEDGVAPEEFYWRLVEAVRAQGADLGVGLNDPTESIEHLSSMLVDVSTLRSQELMGYRYSLANILEHKDGWYFTERYIIPGDQLSYTIEVSRLNEMDWEEHLHGRFEGIHNIPFARRMYGIDRSKFQHVVDDEGLDDTETSESCPLAE
jgi:hypothetical protein